jgi:hypothetical protein
VSIPAPGQAGTASIDLIPTGGFTGSVAISCLLPPAMTGAGCSSSGATLSGAATSQALLIITTAPPPAAGSISPTGARDIGVAAATSNLEATKPENTSRHTRELPAGVQAIPVIALFGLGFGRKNPRRRRMLALLLVLILSPATIEFTACGGKQIQASNSCDAIPNAPTALAASGITNAGAMLSWTAATTDTSCVVAGYKIYRNNTPIGVSAGSAFSVTGLSASTTYSFTISAIDSFGTSNQASPLTVTTASSPTATPPGTYPVTVAATSAGVTKTATFNVTVL